MTGHLRRSIHLYIIFHQWLSVVSVGPVWFKTQCALGVLYPEICVPIRAVDNYTNLRVYLSQNTDACLLKTQGTSAFIINHIVVS